VTGGGGTSPGGGGSEESRLGYSVSGGSGSGDEELRRGVRL
jgi:hypothetical protein